MQNHDLVVIESPFPDDLPSDTKPGPKGESGRILHSAVTDSRIFRMRLKGFSIAQIADKMQMSRASVAFHINRVMDEVNLDLYQSAQQLRDIEVARTEVVAKALYKRVVQGDLDAIKAWHQNIELRAKLLGLFRPQAVLNLNVDLNSLTDEQLERISKGMPLG